MHALKANDSLDAHVLKTSQATNCASWAGELIMLNLYNISEDTVLYVCKQ